MKLTTRSLRNISFVIMLAVLPLARQVPVLAQNCGPWHLDSLCSYQGGYIEWRGCDPDSCVYPVGGANCYDFCIRCDGGGEWDCLG